MKRIEILLLLSLSMALGLIIGLPESARADKTAYAKFQEKTSPQSKRVGEHVKRLRDARASVRAEAIQALGLLAMRVVRIGSKRSQFGRIRAARVKGLVPVLIRALDDKEEANRTLVLYALAGTLDPRAVKAIRKRLTDRSAKVRLSAACLLTEFQDSSGLGEMKRALQRLRDEKMSPSITLRSISFFFETEMLLASFERITGKRMGAIPINPMVSSSSQALEVGYPAYKALLEAWAMWWAWTPASLRVK